jgi:hypothetical protein
MCWSSKWRRTQEISDIHYWKQANEALIYSKILVIAFRRARRVAVVKLFSVLSAKSKSNLPRRHGGHGEKQKQKQKII